MNWQNILDKKILAKKVVDQVLICGKLDGAVLASTPDFKLRMYQVCTLNDRGIKEEKLINEAIIVSKLAQTLLEPNEGIRINGTKYMVVQSFANGSAQDGLATMYLKRSHGGGCFCVTKQMVIMANFDEGKGQNASNCNFTVEKFGRYLLTLGY